MPGRHRPGARTGLGRRGRARLHRQELLHDPPGTRQLAPARRDPGAGSAGGGGETRRGGDKERGRRGDAAPSQFTIHNSQFTIEPQPLAPPPSPLPHLRALHAVWTPARRTRLSAPTTSTRGAASPTGRSRRAASSRVNCARALATASSAATSARKCAPTTGGCPTARLLAGLARRIIARIAPPLLDGFDPAHPYWLDQAAFSEHFARSPIKRAKRGGMLRNVCVALGNWGDPAALAALALALADPDPVARIHAAWALGHRERAPWQHPHVRRPRAGDRVLTAEADERVASRRDRAGFARHGAERRPSALPRSSVRRGSGGIAQRNFSGDNAYCFAMWK